MALFARNRDRYQLDRGGTIVAEHRPPTPPRSMSYPNERAAIAVFRKRALALLEDRWQLIRADADIGGPLAADRGLEAGLHASRGIDELAVYGDWLIEQGDPCGELAALRRDPDPRTRRAMEELEAARGYELYGCYADYLAARPKCSEHVGLTWNLAGWIDAIELRRITDRACPQSEATLAALVLQAPMARFVRRLVVRGDSLPWTLHSAIEHAATRDAIGELVVTTPAMAELATAMPHLRSLVMPSDARTEAGHAELTELTIAAQVDAVQLVVGTWPSVRSLTIRYSGNASSLEPALERLRLDRLPALAELHLDANFDDATLARLAGMVRGFELREARR